jgi:putative addiction module killer protein
MTTRRTGTFDKWLRKLRDTVGKNLILARIGRLEEGNRGNWKPVEGNLFEMRIDYGPGYRVYCKDTGAAIIILLCGGDKTSQDADIARAKRIALEPLQEENNGNG